MRIVHAISDLDPDRGGPPVVCAALASAEARLGHDVTIVCESRDEKGSNDEIVRTLAAPNGAGPSVAVSFVPKQTLFGALYGHLDEHAPALAAPVELIHAHGVWNSIVLAAARVARRRRVPYVVSTHGALHPVCMRDGKAKKRTALAVGWRRMLRDATRILCLNQPEATEANRIARAEVSAIVPNGIDVAAIPEPDVAGFRARVPALRDRPYFVFLGRLDRLKGLDLLFEAFARYRQSGGNADLVVVGPDWGAGKPLAALVGRANLGSHVHVVGPLYDATKFGALAGAVAFVHRPRYEAFGLAVLEAMAVGTPAIVSDACLLPLRGAEDGLVKTAADAEAFAQALARLATNPAEREALGARAREVVRTQFDWEPIARETLRVAGVGGAR
ncbi:MAG: glycosyltransferase [Phycisphaerae bacterium]|nr:glycosyltransferase [Phycisphaerae bacterium]